MNTRTYACFLTLAYLSLALFVTGTGYGQSPQRAGGGFFGHKQNNKGNGAKASDPHLTGPRDMNYDHLIVAGDRIGPVKLDGLVSDAVQHLGEPDYIHRQADTNEVNYYYKDECIGFTWEDSGIDPTIAGFRGIYVTCDKWSTPNGLHVGSSVKDVNAHIGEYCATNREGPLRIATKQSIVYEAKDRNSPVTTIRVLPVANSWYGMCTD
jgi:hypothetical protein